MAASSVVRSSGIGIHLHTYADISQIDHNGIICTRCLRGNLAMPDDVSALQLVLTGDPALVAIVRLALIVSLSASAPSPVTRSMESSCSFPTPAIPAHDRRTANFGEESTMTVGDPSDVASD